MNRASIVICTILATFLLSCEKSDKIPRGETIKEENLATPLLADNSEVSLDWAGRYEGTLPCADCPGIKTLVTLKDDRTFTISEEYLDKSVKAVDEGNFKWDSTGSSITLNGKDVKYKYKVGEGMLIQLDLEGNRIEGSMADAYILKKL